MLPIYEIERLVNISVMNEIDGSSYYYFECMTDIINDEVWKLPKNKQTYQRIKQFNKYYEPLIQFILMSEKQKKYRELSSEGKRKNDFQIYLEQYERREKILKLKNKLKNK